MPGAMIIRHIRLYSLQSIVILINFQIVDIHTHAHTQLQLLKDANSNRELLQSFRKENP